MGLEIQVTFDCADPAALAGFWAQVLHYEVQGPPPGFATWDAALDAFGVPPSTATADQRSSTPRGRSADLLPAGSGGQERQESRASGCAGGTGPDRRRQDGRARAEALRLIELGARRLERFEPAPPMETGFIVMADPEGNEFCLD